MKKATLYLLMISLVGMLAVPVHAADVYADESTELYSFDEGAMCDDDFATECQAGVSDKKLQQDFESAMKDGIGLGLDDLSGCRTTTKEVGLSDFDWQMEFVSDENGNILASNSKDNTADSYKNVSCICDENSNISIIDETEGKSWSGKYSLKVSDKGTKSYDLTFPDDVSVIGILGVREYEDGETAYSFVIYTDDKVVSFLPKAI